MANIRSGLYASNPIRNYVFFHFFLALEAEGGVSQCSHPTLGKAHYMPFNNLFDELVLQNEGGSCHELGVNFIRVHLNAPDQFVQGCAAYSPFLINSKESATKKYRERTENSFTQSTNVFA